MYSAWGTPLSRERYGEKLVATLPSTGRHPPKYWSRPSQVLVTTLPNTGRHPPKYWSPPSQAPKPPESPRKGVDCKHVGWFAIRSDGNIPILQYCKPMDPRFLVTTLPSASSEDPHARASWTSRSTSRIMSPGGRNAERARGGRVQTRAGRRDRTARYWSRPSQAGRIASNIACNTARSTVSWLRGERPAPPRAREGAGGRSQ